MKIRLLFVLLIMVCLPARPINAQNIKSKRDPVHCTEIAKNILSLYDKGDFNGIVLNFDQRLKEGLTPSKLAASWKQMTSQLGPYKGVKETKSEMYVGSTIIYCVCTFGDWAVDFKTVYNGAGKVTALHFLPHNMPALPSADSSTK